jgi:hypothetical protein
MVTVASALVAMRTRVDDRSPEASKLAGGVPRCGMLSPLVAADKELPFNLDGHGPPPFRRMLSISKWDELLANSFSSAQMSHR